MTNNKLLMIAKKQKVQNLLIKYILFLFILFIGIAITVSKTDSDTYGRIIVIGFIILLGTAIHFIHQIHRLR